jgi:hypothetical protein
MLRWVWPKQGKTNRICKTCVSLVEETKHLGHATLEWCNECKEFHS